MPAPSTLPKVAMALAAGAAIAMPSAGLAGSGCIMGTGVAHYGQFASNPQIYLAAGSTAVWEGTASSGNLFSFNDAGTVTSNPVPGAGGIGPVAADGAGNVWFADDPDSSAATPGVGWMRSDGTGAVRFSVPGPWQYIPAIAAGPDGNGWFTQTSNNLITRVTPDGVMTSFPSVLPGPGNIAAGPDGALWFTTGGNIEAGAQGGPVIGRITTTGEVTTLPLPNPKSMPYGITAGPDGNLWFTDPGTTAIGRITPSGAVTEWPIGQPGGPQAITSGAPGSGVLWFSLSTGSLGRVSTSGAITVYPTAGGSLGNIGNWSGIAVGPDTRIWMAPSQCNATIAMPASSTIGTRFTSRPSTMRRGSTYSMTVTSSRRSLVKIGLATTAMRRTLLSQTMPKGRTTVRVTVPRSLPKGLVGRVSLVLNGLTGPSGLVPMEGPRAGQAVAVTVR